MPTIPGTIAATISDEELSAAMLMMLGWKLGVPVGYDTNPQGMIMCQASRPSFATDANAVLALADKLEIWSVECCPWHTSAKFYVYVAEGNPMRVEQKRAVAKANTLPRALCFALLKAKGWTVSDVS